MEHIPATSILTFHKHRNWNSSIHLLKKLNLFEKCENGQFTRQQMNSRAWSTKGMKKVGSLKDLDLRALFAFEFAKIKISGYSHSLSLNNNTNSYWLGWAFTLLASHALVNMVTSCMQFEKIYNQHRKWMKSCQSQPLKTKIYSINSLLDEHETISQTQSLSSYKLLNQTKINWGSQ